MVFVVIPQKMMVLFVMMEMHALRAILVQLDLALALNSVVCTASDQCHDVGVCDLRMEFAAIQR